MQYPLTFQEYHKALKQNRLLGLRCRTCGGVTCPPMMVCQECASPDVEVVQLSGRGTIATFTVSFVAPEGRENELPYTILLVELEEGPWIMGNLIDRDPRRIGMDIIGRRVEMSHRVFPGDKYSAGEAARPVFTIID